MNYTWILEPDDKYEVINNKHDTGYKYLLSVKRVFIQLLKSFVDKSWVNDIDEDSVENINKSFILQDFKGKEADLVYKVKINEQEIFFYILMELQSTVDFQMPYRLLQYMLEIWRTILNDTQSKQNITSIERKDFKLPVIVPCVLYNGRYNWTVSRNFKETLAAFEVFDDYILDFKYILFDVARYSEDELFKIGNLISAIFYIDQKTQHDEIIERLKKLLNLLKNLNDSDFDIFQTWVRNIITKGMEKKEAEQIENIFIENKETEQMIYAIEIAMKEMKQKGKAEGIAQGE